MASRSAARERVGDGSPNDPAPIGGDAFAYETDGGSGAFDRLVVVDTGDKIVVIVVIVANPASPAESAPLTESENLTRGQIDDLVRAAVEKLG